MLKRIPNSDRKAEGELRRLNQEAGDLIKQDKVLALEKTTALIVRMDQDKAVSTDVQLTLLGTHAFALEKNGQLDAAVAIERRILGINPYLWRAYITLAALERRRAPYNIGLRIVERQVLESFFKTAKSVPPKVKKPTPQEMEQAQTALSLNYKQELFPLIKDAFALINRGQPIKALELTAQLYDRLDQDNGILNSETQFSILNVHSAALQANKQFQEAIDVQKQILGVQPYDWISFLCIAHLEKEQANLDGERAILDSFIETASEAPKAEQPTPRQYAQLYTRLANNILDKKDERTYKEKLRDALPWALKAEVSDPSYDSGLSTIGHIYKGLGFLTKASEYYEKSRHAEPESLARKHPDAKQVDHVLVERQATEVITLESKQGQHDVVRTDPPRDSKAQLQNSGKPTEPLKVAPKKPQAELDKTPKSQPTTQTKSKAPKKPTSSTQAIKRDQQEAKQNRMSLTNTFDLLSDDTDDSKDSPQDETVQRKSFGSRPKPAPVSKRSPVAVISESQKQKSRQTDNRCTRLRIGFFNGVSACSGLASRAVTSVAGYLCRRP